MCGRSRSNSALSRRAGRHLSAVRQRGGPRGSCRAARGGRRVDGPRPAAAYASGFLNAVRAPEAGRPCDGHHGSRICRVVIFRRVSRRGPAPILRRWGGGKDGPRRINPCGASTQAGAAEMLDLDLDHIEAPKKTDRFRAASLRSAPRAGNAFRFVDRTGKLRQPLGALGRRGPLAGLIHARSSW